MTPKDPCTVASERIEFVAAFLWEDYPPQRNEDGEAIPPWSEVSKAQGQHYRDWAISALRASGLYDQEST